MLAMVLGAEREQQNGDIYALCTNEIVIPLYTLAFIYVTSLLSGYYESTRRCTNERKTTVPDVRAGDGVPRRCPAGHRYLIERVWSEFPIFVSSAE